MRKLELTIATSDYDHLRDFRIGEVRAEGIDPIWLSMDFHEIFARFAARRDWDVSEMSFLSCSMLIDSSNVVGLMTKTLVASNYLIYWSLMSPLVR